MYADAGRVYCMTMTDSAQAMTAGCWAGPR